MVVQQKLLAKAYFNIKPTGWTMVRPASSDKWKALLKSGSLCYSRFHIIYHTMLQSSLENWVLHHEVAMYRISDSLIVELWFWIPTVGEFQIPWAVFRVPKPRILPFKAKLCCFPNSTSKTFADSGRRRDSRLISGEKNLARKYPGKKLPALKKNISCRV